MKKWLVFILLVVSVAGTFIPCGMVVDCAQDESTSTHNTEEETQGNCSPFFACANCAGFVQPAASAYFEQPAMLVEKHFSKIVSLTGDRYAAPILQPPRHAAYMS